MRLMISILSLVVTSLVGVAQTDYKMAGPYEVVARDGEFRGSKEGSERDMKAAWDFARLGKYEEAKSIINAYAEKLQRLDGHDAPLCLIQCYWLVRAMTLVQKAETATAHAPLFSLHSSFIRRAMIPTMNKFEADSPYANGNWGAIVNRFRMAAAICMADTTMYRAAVDYYLHAYDNGSLPHYIGETGQCQETGRDQGHAQLGLEATSLVVNPTCEKANGGWTKPDGSPSGYYTAPRTWRNSSSSHLDNVNVRTTISQTINHMPAGYYKVVAAMRAADGSQITMNMNNSVNSTFTGFGDAPTTGSQINRNGVQMPYTVPADFAEGTGRGWQWNAAYCHLTADGDLTINFVLNGNGWMAIDDIHLYYCEQAGGFFRITDENNDLTETNKVVTCDVVLNNPNTIITSAAPVITAAGANLNNNLVDGVVSNLVIYDEYNYHAPAESYAATSLTLYRTLQTDDYNTFAVPFAISSEELTELGIKAKQLSSSALADGTLTLNFTNADDIEAGKPYLVKVSANVVNPTFENVTVNDATTTATTDAVDFIPTLDATTIEGDAKNTLFLGAGNKLYNPDAENSQIKGFRAYFQLKGEAAEVRSFRLDFDNGETTDIEQLPLNIEHSDNIYTIDGHRIEGHPTQKGVYIIRSAEGSLQGKNSKKVFIP